MSRTCQYHRSSRCPINCNQYDISLESDDEQENLAINEFEEQLRCKPTTEIKKELDILEFWRFFIIRKRFKMTQRIRLLMRKTKNPLFRLREQGIQHVLRRLVNTYQIKLRNLGYQLHAITQRTDEIRRNYNDEDLDRVYETNVELFGPYGFWLS